MVSLLDDNERDAWLVSNLQLHARLADRSQLMNEHLHELTLAHPITVEDDAGRLEVGRPVELHQQLTNHRRQVLDDLLAVRLDPHGRRVTARVSVHARHHLRANTT